jgi:hypothetical protein
MNPVTEYIQNIKQDWQIEISNRLNELVHQAVPEVTERIQYGKPHYLKNGKYAAVLGTAKDWVSFTIFNAKDVEAPEGVFEAGDPDRKTIKIRKGQSVDYDLLARLLQQAASTL